MKTYEESRPYGKIIHIGSEPREGEPMPPFLVSGLITRAMTLIYGEPGCGKTTMVAALAIALANGDAEFLGRKICAHGPIRVSVISGDPAEDARYEKLMQGTVPDGMVSIVPVHRPPEGDSNTNWRMLCSDLKDRNTGLVIVDNLKAFAPKDEHVPAFLDRLMQFMWEDIPVVLIHHSSEKFYDGRKSRLPLGTTAIRAAARWYLYLQLSASGPLKVEASGKWGAPFELTTTRPDGTARLNLVDTVSPDELAGRRERRSRERGAQTALRRAEIGDWMRAHCASAPTDAERARRIAEKFGGQASTHKARLSEGAYGNR